MYTYIYSIYYNTQIPISIVLKHNKSKGTVALGLNNKKVDDRTKAEPSFDHVHSMGWMHDMEMLMIFDAAGNE